MDIDQLNRELGKLDKIADIKRAAREPHANRLSPIFKRGRDDYECVGMVRNGRDQLTGFYVSWHVNVAGYILTWVSTYAKNGKRTIRLLTAYKTRVAAVACANRRFNKLKAKHGNTPRTLRKE